MTNQYLRDIVIAINSVRTRAKAALMSGDTVAYIRLMGDLSALELCLTIEITKEILNEEKGAA